MNGNFTRCPYCGSIENNGMLCNWCHNPITDDHIPTIYETEDKTMKIRIEFTDLDPAQAMSLIAFASGQNEKTPPVPAMQIGGEQPEAIKEPAEKPIKKKAAASVTKTVTLEEVRAAMMAKSRAGKKEAVQGLINKRGATKLTEIDAAEYPALLEELEAV